MYVCLCRGITDNQIRKAVQAGKTEFRQLKQSLEVGTQCGKLCAHGDGDHRYRNRQDGVRAGTALLRSGVKPPTSRLHLSFCPPGDDFPHHVMVMFLD